jgi:hypothetical protein
MPMNFLTHRFFSAVRICSGDLTIKQRLINAWMEHLDEVDPADMPQCQRQNFAELREVMYERKPLPEESAPQASVRKMSIRQVAAHTDLIIAIYAELVQTQSSPVMEKSESESSIRSNMVTSLDGAIARHLN